MALDALLRGSRQQVQATDKDDERHPLKTRTGRVFAPPPEGSPERKAAMRWPDVGPQLARRQMTDRRRPADDVVVRRSLSNGKPHIRRFVDPATFEEQSSEGFTSNGVSSYRQSIIVLLSEYQKLKPPGYTSIPDSDVPKALSLARSLMDMAQRYMTEGPPAEREPRMRQAMTQLWSSAHINVTELTKRQEALQKARTKQPDMPRAALGKHLPGDPNPLFSKVGKGVGMVAPKNGDKGAFSIELTFPTPSGVNVKGSMLVNAERGNDRLKARARIMLGAAVGVAGFAEISAAVGGYLEAEAQDSTSLGALLERALFDRVSATPGMPDMVVGYLFGSGGSSAGAKAARARMGEIGDRHLKGDNYYESGVELEAKAEAEKAASVTGGYTTGTRRDSARGPAKGTFGISRAIKIETPLEVELQLQAKIGGQPGKSVKLLGGELSGEVVLNHEALTALQKSAETATIAALVFSGVNKGIAAITALSNAKDAPAGLSETRLATGIAGAHAQLIAELIKLQKGLPPPDAPGGPKKKLSLKSAVGVGLKLDLATGKVSAVLRRFTEVDINVGGLAVKGQKSSEASMDFGGAQPPR